MRRLLLQHARRPPSSRLPPSRAHGGGGGGSAVLCAARWGTLPVTPQHLCRHHSLVTPRHAPPPPTLHARHTLHTLHARQVHACCAAPTATPRSKRTHKTTRLPPGTVVECVVTRLAFGGQGVGRVVRTRRGIGDGGGSEVGGTAGGSGRGSDSRGEHSGASWSREEAGLRAREKIAASVVRSW